MATLSRRSVVRGSLGLLRPGCSPDPMSPARPRPRKCGGPRASLRKKTSRSRRSSPTTRRPAATQSTTASRPTRRCVEDRLRGDERRRPGCVPEHPGRDHCGLRLGRQAGRRQRRHRDATGGVHRDRAAHGPLLQQYREEAQLLRCALYRRRFDEPYLAAAGRKGRLFTGGPAEDLGCLLRLLQGGAEKYAPKACAMSMALVFS